MTTHKDVRLTRQQEAIIRWGEANKSDPFARMTAACHYRVGIAGVDRVEYVAEEYTEMQRTSRLLSDGSVDYPAKVHRNLKRP